jgi:hypothetical protein
MKSIIDEINSKMEQHHIESITVGYYGSGDSGDEFGVDDVLYSEGYAEQKEDDPELIETEHPDFAIFHEKKKTLSNSVTEICYQLVGRNHPGWEINEGGGGRITYNKDGSYGHDFYYNESCNR